MARGWCLSMECLTGRRTIGPSRSPWSTCIDGWAAAELRAWIDDALPPARVALALGRIHHRNRQWPDRACSASGP